MGHRKTKKKKSSSRTLFEDTKDSRLLEVKGINIKLVNLIKAKTEILLSLVTLNGFLLIRTEQRGFKHLFIVKRRDIYCILF